MHEKAMGYRALGKNLNHKRRRRLIVVLCVILLLVILVAASTSFLGIENWKDFDPDKLLNVAQTVQIYDAQGQLSALPYGSENRIPITLDQIPQHVRDAVIAVEDERFYTHSGFDIQRIFGALWADIKSGSLDQGASTLTQQLVKNSHLTTEKSWARKIQEVYLAWQMEQRFTKDEILGMYFNYNYFGNGAYGIEAAALSYFGKNASSLTIAEGALLAGVLKSPTKYAPHLHPVNALERRNLVLSLMKQQGMISQEQFDQALAEPLMLLPQTPRSYSYGYYNDTVLRQAGQILDISIEELLSSGYRIYTSQDSSAQTLLEELFAQNALFPEDLIGYTLQSAAVVLDAKTGEVLGLMGGRTESSILGFNRALDMKRQPGSAIKPVLVYAPAIEHYAYTPASFLLDSPDRFGDYTPTNYGGTYYGVVTIREAIARSLNIPAVRVLHYIGVDTGKQYAQQVGISFDERDTGLPLALGGFTYGVSPLQLAASYQPFANGGLYQEPMLIQRIEDPEGLVLYQNTEVQRQVLSPQTSYLLADMMRSTVDFGTAQVLKSTNLDIAAKTGTVSDPAGGNRDAWCVAFNSDIIVAVWMGFDQEAALPLPVTGGTYPARLIEKFYTNYYAHHTAPTFAVPEGVSEVRLDRRALNDDHEAILAGDLAPDDAVVTECFLEGTEPTQLSDYWQPPKPPTYLNAEIDANGFPVLLFDAPHSHLRYDIYRYSLDGQEVHIGRYAGGVLEVRAVDSTALPDTVYYYRIVPVHPSLTNADGELTGGSSPEVRVHTPVRVNGALQF